MDEPTLLLRVPTEPQAMMVKSELEAEGIEVGIEGALTSAFRAEAPGEVSIYVDRKDVERAREIAGTHGVETAATSSRSWTGVVAMVIAAAIVLSLVVAMGIK